MVVRHELYESRIRLNEETTRYYSETLTVPNTDDPTGSGYYFVKLTETPSSNIKILIGDMIETTGALAENNFRVDYILGFVYFHASKVNSSVTIKYYGIGSRVRADDINSKVSKEIFSIFASNNSGISLVKNKVVKLTGIDPASGYARIALVDDLADEPYGIIRETIADGSVGDVIVYGILPNALDTTSATIGDSLFFDISANMTLVDGGGVPLGKIVTLATSGVVKLSSISSSSVAAAPAGGGSLGVTEQELLKLETQSVWGGM